MLVVTISSLSIFMLLFLTRFQEEGRGGGTMQNKEIHMVKKKNDVHDKLLASFRRHSFIERIWAHSGGTVSLIGLRSGCRIFLIRPDLG